MPTPSIVILLGFLALAAGQVTAFVAIMNAMNKRFDERSAKWRTCASAWRDSKGRSTASWPCRRDRDAA